MKWYASAYLDGDEWGVISEDNIILVRISDGFTEEQCRKIVKLHNREEGQWETLCAVCGVSLIGMEVWIVPGHPSRPVCLNEQSCSERKQKVR